MAAAQSKPVPEPANSLGLVAIRLVSVAADEARADGDVAVARAHELE